MTHRYNLLHLTLIGLVCMTLHAKEHSPPIKVTFHDAHQPPLVFNALSGHLTLDTDYGKLEYGLQNIAAIERITGEERVDLVTAAGDRISGLIDTFKVTPADASATHAINERLPRDLTRITTSAAVRPTSARHQARILLANGGRIHAYNGDDVTIELESGGNRLSLPLLAPRVIRVSPPNQKDDDWSCSLSFPNSQLLIGSLLFPKNHLRILDQHGNRISIPFDAMTGIIGAPAPDLIATTRWKQETTDIVLRDATHLRTSIPAITWVLDTMAGRIALPATMTLSLERLPGNAHDYRLATCYGERFQGNLQNSRIAYARGTETAYYEARQIDRYTIESEAIAPPVGWLRFLFMDGTRLLAQFADEQFETEPSSSAGWLDSLTGLARSVDGAWIAELSSGESRVVTPTHRKGQIISLTSGERLSFKWSDLAGCGTGIGKTPQTPPPALPTQELTPASPPPPPSGIAPLPKHPVIEPSQVPEPTPWVEPAPLRIKTIVGSLDVDTVTVKHVRVISAKHSEVVFQDNSSLIGHISRRAFKKWAKQNGIIAAPDKDKWVARQPPIPSPPPTLAIGASMALLPAGSFMMGSNDLTAPQNQKPAHRITLPAFWMDKAEISRARFAAFIDDTHYQTVAERLNNDHTWRTPGITQNNNHPAVCISWIDAVMFCNWRSKQCGLRPYYKISAGEPVKTLKEANGFRLPTEAEWEYAACSAGRSVEYPWEHASSEPSANFLQTAMLAHVQPTGTTTPSGTFLPTQQGIHDLAGNAWEWCEDVYNEMAYRVPQRPAYAPVHEAGASLAQAMRVMRGGSFHNELNAMRTTHRGFGLPFASNNRTGFRCVRNYE
jgi:sulfatase modifying factor 1